MRSQKGGSCSILDGLSFSYIEQQSSSDEIQTLALQVKEQER